MMEILCLKEENVIKDIRNLFRLKKELNYIAIKDIRNIFFWQEKETNVIKDRTLRDIKNFFECEEETYYKPVTVIFGVTIILNSKGATIEIKYY